MKTSQIWGRTLVAAVVAASALSLHMPGAPAATKTTKKAVKSTKTTKAAATTVAPATTAAPASASASDVDPNGSATFAYAATASNMDPHMNTQSLGDLFLRPVYDSLMWIGDDMLPKPHLATKWGFSADASTFTLTLRTDATFADGSKLDASAVAANLNRARTIRGGAYVLPLNGVTNVAAPDATTVVLSLQKGYGVQLPTVLTGNAGMIVNPKAFANPSADLTTGPGNGNGSGPYEVTSFQAGAGGKVTYQQRPNIDKYWDKGAGQLKKLTWINIPTQQQRINGVLANDLNMAQVTGVDVQQARDLIASGKAGGKFYVVPAVLQTLWLRATRPPLNNLKIRQAIALAINREAFNKGLFSGNCEPTNQDFADGWAHVKALDSKMGSDIDKAKKLVAESGVKDPAFTLVAVGTTWQPQALAVQQILKDIGINVKFELTPPTAGGPSFAKGDFDAQQGAFVINPDPAAVMNDLYFGGVGLIPPDAKAEFELLAGQLADPKLDQAARAAIWSRVAQALHDDAYVISICQSGHVWLTNNTIGGQDLMRNTKLGLPDIRYLYVKKK